MARRQRRRKLPQDPIRADIENLSHDGRGIARIAGKTIFISGALKGETVQFLYTKRQSKFDEGRAVEIISASADRVEDNCQYGKICGGCSLTHMAPQAQLALKQNTLAEQMSHFGELQPEEWLPPLTGPLWGYRRKARLGVKYVTKKQRVLVGFREKGTPYLAMLDQCQVLDPRIGLRLAELAQLIERLTVYQHIAQIEVAMDDQHVALIFRNLKDLSEQDQQILTDYGQENQLWIYLQPAGPDSVTALWPKTIPQLSYSPDKTLSLQFSPNNFTQVNNEINQKMIKRALELLELSNQDRVLDLFCGLGNFSLPLAQRVAEVVGVEGDDALVAQARANAQRNKISNAMFERADLTEARLKNYAWAAKGFNKILLDPPRSGALEVLSQLVELAPEKIVYISCNPATLARDAGELVHRHGYRLRRTGIMDMFPHTSHVESIAVFSRD